MTLAENFEEGEEASAPFPPQEKSDDEAPIDSEGFIRVAGEGACPGGQNEERLRRAGAGRNYGSKHAHNPKWRILGLNPIAQRAEVSASLRWAAWSWS